MIPHKHNDLDIELDDVPTLEKTKMNRSRFLETLKISVLSVFADMPKVVRPVVVIVLIAIVLFAGVGAKQAIADSGSVWSLVYIGDVENCDTRIIELQEQGLLDADEPSPVTLCTAEIELIPQPDTKSN